jgi:hypothetical protein
LVLKNESLPFVHRLRLLVIVAVQHLLQDQSQSMVL